jgi:molybdopterin converting factor small subunit
MARVNVKLYAGLRAYNGGAASIEVDVNPGETIEQVLAKLCLPRDKAAIIFLDHRAASPSHPLNGGEQLGLFPAIGGG